MDFIKDEIELIKSCIEAKVESVHDNAPPPDPAFYDVPGGHLDTGVKLIYLDWLSIKVKGVVNTMSISFTKDERTLILDCLSYNFPKSSDINIHRYLLMDKIFHYQGEK